MDKQILIDSLKHEAIKQKLEKTSRHIVAHIEAIQELRNKYKVRGCMRVQRNQLT